MAIKTKQKISQVPARMNGTPKDVIPQFKDAPQPETDFPLLQNIAGGGQSAQPAPTKADQEAQNRRLRDQAIANAPSELAFAQNKAAAQGVPIEALVDSKQARESLVAGQRLGGSANLQPPVNIEDGALPAPNASLFPADQETTGQQVLSTLASTPAIGSAIKGGVAGAAGAGGLLAGASTVAAGGGTFAAAAAATVASGGLILAGAAIGGAVLWTWNAVQNKIAEDAKEKTKKDFTTFQTAKQMNIGLLNAANHHPEIPAASIYNEFRQNEANIRETLKRLETSSKGLVGDDWARASDEIVKIRTYLYGSGADGLTPLELHRLTLISSLSKPDPSKFYSEPSDAITP